jgi:hypothetical protein
LATVRARRGGRDDAEDKWHAASVDP